MRILVGEVRPIRKVAKREEFCHVCREAIPRDSCVSVIPGVASSSSHKKCEPEMIAREIERREKNSIRMLGNTFGEKK